MYPCQTVVVMITHPPALYPPQSLSARAASLEASLADAQRDAAAATATGAGRVKDKDRRIDALKDEVSQQQEQISALERILREKKERLVGIQVRSSRQQRW